MKGAEKEIFKTDFETIKERNMRKIAEGEDPENKKFGRWALSVLKDSAFSPTNRAQSRIEQVNVEAPQEKLVMRERSAANIKPKNYGRIAPAGFEGNERQIKHETRLEQMGLKDPTAVQKLNGGKIIDQMQWHTDLMTGDYDTNGNEL